MKNPGTAFDRRELYTGLIWVEEYITVVTAVFVVVVVVVVVLVLVAVEIQGKPVNQVTNGPQISGHINRVAVVKGFFK